MTARLRVVNAVLPGVLASASAELLARLLERESEVVATVEDFAGPSARIALARAEVLVTGWGTPRIDAEVLDAAPALRHILHVGGSVKDLLSPAVWERGITVSSAVDANAIPVAEYTLAMILIANKKVLPLARRYRKERSFIDQAQLGVVGNYRRRVGIVGASRIGRRVIELLRPFDLDVVVHDPTLSDAAVSALGATPAALEQLCATCDIVSVHAPSLPTTLGLISRTLIDSMPQEATLINTSRGAVVDQNALVDRVLRGDLYAVLDVTSPWVLPADHPFYEHPNVVLTPHIAGSIGTEVDRMIEAEVEELRRISAGEALAHPVELGSLGTAA